MRHFKVCYNKLLSEQDGKGSNYRECGEARTGSLSYSELNCYYSVLDIIF